MRDWYLQYMYLGNFEGVPNEFSGKNTGTIQASFKSLKVFIESKQVGF